MKNGTFVCLHCGTVRPVSEQVLVHDEAVCEDCALEHTVLCSQCGERIWVTDSICDVNLTLCERCFDHSYTRCVECERIIPNASAYFDDENEAYCETCWNEISGRAAIHEYSYRPDAIFYGSNDRYFGVELEIDCAGKDPDYARIILDVANENTEHLYIKSDGSLNDGMELVTHPMTLDYHLNSMPWCNVLAAARSLGYLSHKTTTCGLHVHISRRTFGATNIQQECTIARLLYFVEKFWPELLRFSRRTERQINRWAARYGMKMSPQEVMDSAKYSHTGRYAAVNLTNYSTIEIRIFRGTLKLNTLLATLQMVNAICDVALFMSDEALQALSWHAFLNRLDEPELIQYLKERDLYKNEPLMIEEDD